MISIVLQTWDSLDQQMINNLVNDFTRRIDLVFNVNGSSISHYLSSHMSKPRFLKSEQISRRTFTPSDDELIIQEAEKRGHKWTEIANCLGWPHPFSVKNRYRTLRNIERNKFLDSHPPLPPVSTLLEGLGPSFESIDVQSDFNWEKYQ